MPVDSNTALLGSDPVALFYGGGVALLLTAPLVAIVWKGIGRDGRLASSVGLIAGILFGLAAYAAGAAIQGLWRVTEPAALAQALIMQGGSVPWAMWLAALIGGIIVYRGTRASWNPAGSFTLAALTLALAGWMGFLVTERLPVAVSYGPLLEIVWVGFILAQLLAATLLFCYALYTLDALVRRRWKRSPAEVDYDPELVPKVALHVPTFNEPPEMVATTLDGLLGQDYPEDRLLVLLVDDSTDEECIRGLRAVCEERDVPFIHREDRAGYKAGALNEALRQTPDDYEVIGVVDADFRVEPDFIKDNVGYFASERVSFVQTPQEISNLDDSWVSRYAGYGQRFFYQTAMHTRNEDESIIFCGTMGLLRRSALDDVGGWLDGHVCEDADLSFRLKDAGYSSVYIGDKVYGRGLVPAIGESYRGQQGRWANGGARLLHDYMPKIVAGRMSLKQKFHHFFSSVFWFDGTLAVIFAATLSLLALTFLTGIVQLEAHQIAFLAFLPVLIIGDSTIRMAIVAKRRLDARARDVFGLLVAWWSVKLITSTEAWAGLLGSKKPFLRTPKFATEVLTRGEALVRAFRVTVIESSIALWLIGLSAAVVLKLTTVGAATTYHTVLFSACAAVLLFYALYFGAAWLTVYLGHTTQRAGGKAVASALRTTNAVAMVEEPPS